MPVQFSAWTARSVSLVGALLLSTTLTAPAYAQIETVVVTAERKAEDIQTVPIAVTALTSADLKSKQVNNFRDLQFHVPSVTYTKSNFGGAQFQIRGITTQFGLGAAIAQNENNIYIEAPQLVTGGYFDVDRIEVSRGPQSTLYGRAATGGVVNIITSKPDLDQFAARASLDVGTYGTVKPEVMVNIPLIDGELGIRFAALGVYHDGYEKNNFAGPSAYPEPFDGSKVKGVNDQGTAAGRVSVRWEPSSDTTIDIGAEVGYESDRRVRGDKQLCHRDPSGVIGCLPDKLAFDPINLLSTLGATLGSKQGVTALLNSAFGVNFGLSQVLGNTLGLYNLAGNGGPGDPGNPLAAGAIRGISLIPGPFTFACGPFNCVAPQPVNGAGSGAGGIVTPNLLSTNSAFAPKYLTSGGTYTFNWAQTINSWLKSTLDLGYVNGYQRTFQDYNDATPENISSLISSAVTGFHVLFDGSSNASGAYNTYFSVPGALPISAVYYNGKFGSYAGSIDPTHGILTRNSINAAYDEDDFSSREVTGELRFQTTFDGPLNFSAGAFWMSFDSRNQYWVAANGLDWESMVIGAFVGQSFGGLPLMAASTSYDGEYRRGAVQSRSAFLEGTYDIIPDELRFIAGARFNDDRDSDITTPIAVGGLLLANGFPLIGTPSCTANGGEAAPGCVGWQGTFREPTDITGKKVDSTDLWTGRATLNWTPKLDFTEQTLVYFTASRGELAGGVNKAQGETTLVVPAVFKPATVDALELGTKNTLLDGTLQANLDVWYYNYENYQVGIIDNRAALEFNVPAHLYGLEGEFVWQPDEDLAFNLTLSLTHSAAGNSFVTDQRNPTAGLAGSILVKDLTNGSLCVIVPIDPGAVGHTPGDSSALPPGTVGSHVNNFYLPNGGNAAIDAPFGVPLVNYGLCQPSAPGQPLTATRTALRAAGFDYSIATNPITGALITAPTSGPNSDVSGFNRDGTGIAINLHGNKLPDIPNAQVGVGAQWTAHVGGGFTLVPRVDYYWQSSMESRVFHDGADFVPSWDTINGQLQLNSPGNKWYVRVFATNMADKRNPTGIYLTDPTSALFTNVFAEDPRVVGVSIGANW